MGPRFRTRAGYALAARRVAAATVAAVVTAATLSIAATPANATSTDYGSNIAPNSTLGRQLVEKVTLHGVWRHISALQRIADENGGRRLAGTSGFDASAKYIHDRLAAAGLDVSYQDFEFWYSEELAPPELTVIAPTPMTVTPNQVMGMQYSASGEVTAMVQAVDVVIPPTPKPSSTSGCTPEDFADFKPGNIALVQRGGCGFENKVQNAQNAGAVAIIVFNEGQPGRTEAFFGTLKTPSTVPVVNISYDSGVLIQRAGSPLARVKTSTKVDRRATRNVIAETRCGNPSNVVMAGAHFDSVQYGAGMNDNGSGVAALLEAAIQLGQSRVANKVRFGFWAAEEFIMLGSDYFMSQLDEEQRRRIALYMNFDMLASKNFVRFVLDGDNPDGGAPAGSAIIERVFRDFYDESGKPVIDHVFDGGSDYQAFFSAGIPVGGLSSGSTGLKTAEQAAIFGGTAGAPYDPCNHLACDTMSNLDPLLLRDNADAVAFAVGRFARDVTDVKSSAAAQGV